MGEQKADEPGQRTRDLDGNSTIRQIVPKLSTSRQLARP